MELDNRMISAEWLKNRCYEICDEYNTEHLYIDRIIDEIDNAPDLEVVRCKDCKYATDMMPIENSGGCLMGECTLRKEDDIVFTAWGDEFCSHGERKDNG